MHIGTRDIWLAIGGLGLVAAATLLELLGALFEHKRIDVDAVTLDDAVEDPGGD